MDTAYYNAINERRIYYLVVKEINKLRADNDNKNVIIYNLVNNLKQFEKKDETGKLNLENWLHDEILKNEDETWLK